MGSAECANRRKCHPDWLDADWWEREIAAIVRDDDPVRGNLRITVAHDRLSLALREVTRRAAGANFHTWAVWGSKKTGATIRREDTRALQRAVALGSALAGSVPLLLARRCNDARARLIWAMLGVALVAGPPRALTRRLENTSERVLAGNRTVLEDIGLPTARFAAEFQGAAAPDEERLASFLATLRPGPTECGGQDLLRRAYTHYFHARWSAAPEIRHQEMLAANYTAILHEHLRLDPYIDAAIPRCWRRWTTRRLLSFAIGGESLRVSADLLPAPTGPFPDTLRTLVNAELAAFLTGPAGWDRTPESLAGSAASDWTEIGDRMNYIVDLFRSRHLHDDVFAPPFTAAQLAVLADGRIPPGPL